MHGSTHQQRLDQSDTADQSFDLAESGMMSFQDIKTELDMVQPTSLTQRDVPSFQQHGYQQQRQSPQSQIDDQERSIRHILAFPFRIPTRPEKKVNVAIKEFEDAALLTQSNRKIQAHKITTVDKDKVNDTNELSKQFEKSHFARVRARFVVPCILVRGKNICRSATLSNEVEVFMHSFNQKINDLNQKRKMFLYGTGERSPDKEDRESSLEKQRLEDIELLHQLGVTYINDLMVENRKVKYGLKVTSSEKVDSFGRYSKFKLVATPYPGVEFFQKFKANKYSAHKLRFDWSQNFADAELQLPPGHDDNLGIRWRDYKSWDLIELTQNYLRLYLTHIADDTKDRDYDFTGTVNSASGTPLRSSKGLLIHCISGWDRTPLFISLLRISLWADGEAHQSLTAAEMLYLTMGYDWFLFNEEFSLNSISNLSKQDKASGQPNSQRLSSQSSMSENIERPRENARVGSDLSVSANSDIDSILQRGFVCNDCRPLQKSPNEPVGMDVVKSGGHDAASSTDGKASSWQLVTFSTPPGRPGSSPRGPFVPTLQSMSRTSGSPLGAGAKRSSYLTGFTDESGIMRNALDQEVIDAEQPSSTSPFMMSDGRFRLGTQQFGARRSSSSGIPDLFADESKRISHTGGPSGISSLEFLRVATSPNLLSGRSNTEMEESVYGSRGGSPGAKQATPRKRASTFDGGLLISGEQDADADDADGRDQEEDDEEEEDLTSVDEDNGNESSGRGDSSRIQQHTQAATTTSALPTSSPLKALGPKICKICHLSFFSDTPSSRSQANPTTNSSSYTSTGRHIPVNTDSPSNILLKQQQYRQPSRARDQPLERIRVSDRLFSQDDNDRVCHRQQVNEPDRDEGMFQLEIDDRPSYPPATTLSSCSEKSELDRLGAPCLPGLGYQDGSLGAGDSCSDRDRCAPVADETESIEGDENESFWDETSTLDYGCSPGSLLNGFGLGLTKCHPDHVDGLDLDPGSLGRPTDDIPACEDEDDEDDEDDDCAASLNSRQSSIKMDHHESDRLFMPSLTGVFSAADRPSRLRGRRQDDSSLENSFPLHAHAPFTEDLANRFHPLADGAKDGSTDSLDQKLGEETEPNVQSAAKMLSRRQKLRQLRRLFMDIRNEIGDGVRSPSRPLLPDNKDGKVPPLSAEDDEEEDDGSSLFRAESFSDDPSLQYRSPIAAVASFANRRGGSMSTGTSSTTPVLRSNDFNLEQPFFARSSASSSTATRHPDSFVISPDARPQQQHHQQLSQQQQQSQGFGAPSLNGRKSPFEWAAAAASSAAASISSSASGIVSGGFGNSTASSISMRHSPLMKPSPQYMQQQQPYSSPSGTGPYSRQFTLPSPHTQFVAQQQPLHHHPHQQYKHTGGSLQSPVLEAMTPLGDLHDRTSSSEERIDNTRRRSLATSTVNLGSLSVSSPVSSSSTRIRGTRVESAVTGTVGGDSEHMKEKSSENSGRWD
ncbi:Myotubularin- protein 14, partial [Dissophora globulifera]